MTERDVRAALWRLIPVTYAPRMEMRSRRAILTLATVAALVLMPASASADCNGPGCEPESVVDGSAIALTIVIVLAFSVVMAAVEIRRR